MNKTVALIQAGPLGPTVIEGATLTSEHALSSYGLPVLVIGGHAYGPGDIAVPALLAAPRWTPDEIRAASAAGWKCGALGAAPPTVES